MKSWKTAYFLMLILGFQGVHQFYLGNWRRGLMIAFFMHIPMFAFAYFDDQKRATGQEMPLLAAVLIFFGLMIGVGLFLWDLATLRRQIRDLPQ